MKTLFVLWALAQTGTSTAPPDGDAPPFTDAQLDWLESMKEQLREEAQSQGGGAAISAPSGVSPSILEFKAEAYTKWLYRNNTSQGCVTYGNPHPSGDNFAGDNGACPELALTITGRPTAKIEGSFRIQSRYGQQFADYFENGDLRDIPDASSESLGQNHSAPLQLRGIYVRVAQPVPYVDWFLAGSSDLGMFDPFTVGRVRFIERFNAKGLFLQTSLGEYAKLLLARIALSKLYGTANYNSLEDPLLTNPFWARDAVYAFSLGTLPALADRFSLTVNGSVVLDEEADRDDPDAPGSTNTNDPQDGITAAAPRFLGMNGSVTANLTGFDAFRAKLIVALSHNAPSEEYVSNIALGGLGFSNVVYDTNTDLAAIGRFELVDLLGEGSALKLEYFNIGANFNAVVGSRREEDVLLTDGFLDGGQLPTLNLANELIDFNDKFYESCVGWHGGTLVVETTGDVLDFTAEGTFLTYNTNLQDRNMDLYPGFGGFTGYTDTQLYSYANTNDRGRDPRTVYARNQDRISAIGMAKVRLKPDLWRGAEVNLKLKYIFDKDGRDADLEEDDYQGNLLMGDLNVGGQLLDQLSGNLGMSLDSWSEDGRSGTYAGGRANFVDYRTLRLRPYLGLRYSLGALSAGYHLELVTKNVTTSDPVLDASIGPVIRSVGWIAAQF